MKESVDDVSLTRRLSCVDMGGRQTKCTQDNRQRHTSRVPACNGRFKFPNGRAGR